jgi:dihydroxy-acid dehydratase
MEGGPIAIVKEGDLIEIDIPQKTVTLLLSNDEIAHRLNQWSAPEPKIKKGWLARYAAHVSSAASGAVMQL